MDSKEDQKEKDYSEAFLNVTKNVDTVFEEEQEKWKLTMTKVFGDLHPYNFYITHGHSIYCQSNDENGDISARASNKSQTFERLQEMHEIDKKAEEEFHQLLSSMRSKEVTPSLKEFLEERQKECVKVFQQFDEIVAQCEKYFDLEYNDCRKRVEEQLEMQKLVINDVERYLSEVEDAGDKEINLLKDNIANYVRDVGMSSSDKVEEMYEEVDAQPPIMETWTECAKVVTYKDVRNTFLTQQQDTARLWKKAFDDVLMLSSELKRYRYNYNMIKLNLERAIYWMNRNYRDNMPEFTKTQRQISSFVDRKSELSRKLKNLEQEVKKQKYEQQHGKLKLYSKIANNQKSNKLLFERAMLRHRKVFDTKKTEVLDLLNFVLRGDKEIYEKILNVPWNNVDLSFLEAEKNKKSEISDSKSQIVQTTPTKKIKTLQEDDFADAYRELISSGGFEILLNHIAEELGYMLDFHWVDYVKKTLQIDNQVRWLELFKVFKIDFEEDLKGLKDHVMKFSKSSKGEVMFDINGALDGFLQFAWLKRKPDNLNDLPSEQTDQKIHREFWDSVDKVTPECHLWDAASEVLGEYHESLLSRQRLLALRSDLTMENEKLDSCLENYHTFAVPASTRK